MNKRTRLGLISAGLLLTSSWIFADLFVSTSPSLFVLHSVYSLLASTGNNMNSHTLEFALGERGDDIVKRANYAIKKSGVSSALIYDAPNTHFQLKDKTHGLTFPKSRYILFYDDAKDTYGVDEVDMTIELPDGPEVSDPADPRIEAYDREVYALVMDVQQRIQAAGWQRFIMLSDPRLIGRATYNFKTGYLQEPSIANLVLHSPFLADPDYRLTWEDWQNLTEGFIWKWQVGGMRLELSYMPSFYNEPTISHTANLDIKLQTAANVTGASHPNEATRAKYANSLMDALSLRIKYEEQARAAGLKILDSYQDPTMVKGIPIPSMESAAQYVAAKALAALKQEKANQPLRMASNETCPKTGWWFSPASANSRRYFREGAIFPKLESDYGLTFWIWSPDQSIPSLR